MPLLASLAWVPVPGSPKHNNPLGAFPFFDFKVLLLICLSIVVRTIFLTAEKVLKMFSSLQEGCSYD